MLRTGGGTMTDDGINHGKCILTDCLWAVVEKYEDGYLLCPILSTGGKCEDCMESYERWLKREDR